MRPSIEETMLEIAGVLARRATCSKLAVGCVLTDVNGKIIGSGYNGVPHGMPHCIDEPCPGCGTPAGSDKCIAVHAEMNAIINCGADIPRIHTCYTTHAPCLRCVKTLLNTGCVGIVHSGGELDPAAKDLWLTAGRSWRG